MPQFVVLRLPEIPDVGEVVDAKVGRFDTADGEEAVRALAAQLQELRLGGSVYALVPAGQVARRFVRPIDSLTVEP